MNEFNIRLCTTKDMSIIKKTGSETFYETWRPVNTEEDMQLYLAKSFDDEHLKAELNSKEIFYFLAFDSDEVAGYAKLRTDRTYKEVSDRPAIEMERIYVYEKCQKKRAGKALMDFCIEFCREQNFYWLWLGVNKDNEKAIPFYKNYGFEIFGSKMFKLGNALDEDYLMRLKLS